jgi:hypothetical protein
MQFAASFRCRILRGCIRYYTADVTQYHSFSTRKAVCSRGLPAVHRAESSHVATTKYSQKEINSWSSSLWVIHASIRRLHVRRAGIVLTRDQISGRFAKALDNWIITRADPEVVDRSKHLQTKRCALRLRGTARAASICRLTVLIPSQRSGHVSVL